MRRRGPDAVVRWLVVTVSLLAGSPAAAQKLPEAVPPPDIPGFLNRSEFSLMLALLGTSDPRFKAAGALNADVDIADYGSGRVNVFVDYQGVLGSERRAFDLNHGNYIMEASASWRFGEVEVSGVYHHVSRHVNDRENAESVSWNVLGVRAARQWRAGQSTIDGQVDLGSVEDAHFVDYTFAGSIGVALRRPLSERVGVYAGGRGELLGVDDRIRDHGPCGARIEGGLRFLGRGAELEVFLAYERRIDAYPTEFSRVRFPAFGVRLTNR